MLARSFKPEELANRIPKNNSFTKITNYRCEGESMIGVIRVKDDRPPNAWECHSDGDELLVVLAGSLVMTLRSVTDARETSIALEAGNVLFIPRGIPHSARLVTDHVDIMFITPVTGNHDWLETEI